MATKAAGFLIFRQVNNKIQYLLLRASYGAKHWTPPKGHVDPGEDDYTTALRETKEEAGYAEADLTIFKENSKTLNYVVKGQDKTVVYWLAQLNNPTQEPTLSEEHTEFQWLPKDMAISLSGYNDFADMLDTFHEDIKVLLKL